MSQTRLVFDGLGQLQAELRALPLQLGGEAAHIVEGRANGATVAIRSGYPVRAGELRDKTTVKHTRRRFGARSVVRNASKHALPFEIGTQARHTALGANRGSMPANPLFSHTIRRERRAMYGDFKDLLVRNGLRVSGDA